MTNVSSKSIRRWLTGYEYTRAGALRQSGRVIVSDLAIEFAGQAMSFTDLIEIRFIHAFRRHGVSWPTIKTAAQRAKQILNLDHPFAHRQFKTDGRYVLTVVQREIGGKELYNLLNTQYEFEDLLTQYLQGDVTFGGSGLVNKWHPLDGKASIVIDPTRCFGQPIAAVSGIPTKVLKRAFDAEGSVETVCKLFDVGEQALRDALEFEEMLVA